MLDRLKRRYFDKKFRHEMDDFVLAVDDMTMNIAHENGISESEAREFVIYALSRNPLYFGPMQSRFLAGSVDDA